MRFLLDAHVFLWYISEDKRLKATHTDLIEDIENEVYLSVISVWEAAIKQVQRKLQMPASAGVYLPAARRKHNMLPLTFDEASIRHLSQLPRIHNDSFDRMLICQAIENDLTLVSDDRNIKRYPVRVI
jgi:PIN domain nuclease of toxin-antitoxin system